jgi:glycosyltransferase involved in cell wall biosynthesis
MLITTVILAKNEKNMIEDCILNAQALGGEVLVIDNESTDNTAELARKKGATVVSSNIIGFSELKNFALTVAHGEFVLFLDADERLDPELIQDIKEHVENHKGTVGRIKLYNYFNGKKLHFGITCPEYYYRLFPKDAPHFVGLVHEHPVFTVPSRNLKGHMLHLNSTFFSMDMYSNKMVKYAKLWAEGTNNKGKTSSPLKAIFKACWAMFKYTFLKLGIFGGPKIWAYNLYYSVGYTFLKYQLLAEIESSQKKDDSIKNEEIMGKEKKI